MATSSADHTELPPEARRRIEQLETALSELTGALSTVVTEMRRLGLTNQSEDFVSLAESRLFRKIAHPEARLAGPASYARVKLAKKPGCVSAAALTASASAAVTSGEAARLEWVTSGEVVPAKKLAGAWGLTPQALGPAAKRGQLFAVVIKGLRYYPKEFLKLERDDVAAVCKQLEPLEPSQKLFFWKQQHGALGGRTAAEVLSDREDGRPLLRVVQVANSRAAQARSAAQTEQ